MKKNLIFAALIAAATIFSCAKEPVTNDNTDSSEPAEVTEEEGVYVYTLSASMETLSDEAAPQNPEEQNNEEQNQDEQNPEDGEVKATISDAGTFAWDAGDAIAVFATNGQKYTFTASAAGASATFTTTASVSGLDFSGCKAYYPASIAGASAGSVTLPSAYESIDVARKAFPMEGTVSAEGTISFKHLGGLLKVTINNVPSFAKRFELSSNKSLAGSFSVASEKITAGSTAGSVSIDFTHSTNENMSFYIPVPTGSHTFSMNLKDAATGGNTIIGVTGSKSSTIYRANMSVKKALTVGPVILVKNATEWGSLSLNFSSSSLSSSSVNLITIGNEQYYYAVASTAQTGITTAITITKSGANFPAMYDKSITLSAQENTYIANSVDGIRLNGANTKRIHVEILEGSTNSSMYDTFVHIWGGASADNTTWTSNNDSSRKILSDGTSSVVLGEKAKGYVNNGTSAGSKLMVYIDLTDNTQTFSIRLHNSSNEGGELSGQAASTTSRYAFYNRILRRYTYQMDAWDNLFGVSNPDPYSCPDTGYEIWLYNNAGYWVGTEKLHVYGSPNWKDYVNNKVDSEAKIVGGKTYRTWYLDKGTATATQTILFFNDDANQVKDTQRPQVNFGSDWEKGIISLN